MTTAPYDALAPHYVEYARRRSAYLHGVDQCLVGWTSPGVASMLDVGSGDGSRAVRLAATIGATRLVLSDPSTSMVEQCRRHSTSDVWCCAAEDLPDDPDRFDLITCLWNVLAAVEGTSKRVQGLTRMCACLSPRGRIVLDVHNRYNIATAGVVRVAARMWRDLARPSDSNGEIDFLWDVAGQQIPSRGYLFTPREMSELVLAAGLRVVHRAYVEYDSGAVRGPWTGQLMFCLERA